MHPGTASFVVNRHSRLRHRRARRARLRRRQCLSDLADPSASFMVSVRLLPTSSLSSPCSVLVDSVDLVTRRRRRRHCRMFRRPCGAAPPFYGHRAQLRRSRQGGKSLGPPCTVACVAQRCLRARGSPRSNPLCFCEKYFQKIKQNKMLKII